MSEVAISYVMDTESVRKLAEQLSSVPQEIPRILKAAVNSGTRMMRRKMTQVVAERTGFSTDVVGRRMWGRYAKPEALVGVAKAGKIGWPWADFQPEQTDKGVNVRVLGGTRLLEHAFIATMPGGHTGVYRRAGAARLPIDEQRTDSATTTILEAAATPEVKEAGNQAAMKTMDREVRKVLEGRK